MREGVCFYGVSPACTTTLVIKDNPLTVGMHDMHHNASQCEGLRLYGYGHSWQYTPLICRCLVLLWLSKDA